MAGIMKKRFQFWGPKRAVKEGEVRREPRRELEEEEVCVVGWEEEVKDLGKDREEGGQ